MLDSFRIESASVSDRGLSEKRPQNEDSFLEIPQSGIFAVADGVGGAQAGEVASQMAMEILGEAFINVKDHPDAEEVMRIALEKANAAIHQMSTELPQLATMATTVVALHIAGNIATIGHAGDSRLYRLDAEGQLHRETDDHSMVAEEVRAGRMTEEQADNHPGKNIISRALGAEPTVEVELKTIMVGPNTTFLICSDGVTRHIGDPELAEMLRSGDVPGAICERIKEKCFERGAEDNLTAVIVRLTGEPQAADEPAPIAAHVDDDEPMVATARNSANAVSDDDLDDDELLELETSELSMPRGMSDEPDVFVVHESRYAETVPDFERTIRTDEPEPAESEPADQLLAEHEHVETEPVADEDEGEYETSAVIALDRDDFPAAAEEPAPVAETPAPQDNFAMFGGEAKETAETEEKSGSIAKIASMVGLLLLGSIIGLGAYHYLLANRNPQPVPQPLEIQTKSQPQTAFEESRRIVDKDPDAALKRFEAEPKDAENRFLVGRALLLTGKFPEARKAFLEAKEKITSGEVDPNNATTIKTDIALAMPILNDPLAQVNLKKEFEENKPAANNAAGNANKPKP